MPTSTDLVTKAGSNAWLVVDDLLDLCLDAVFVFDDGDWADSTCESGNVARMARCVDIQDALPCSCRQYKSAMRLCALKHITREHKERKALNSKQRGKG